MPPENDDISQPLPGQVAFVSAGPGDPDLLTVKAVRYLQSADVVLFDDLASGPILDLASPQAELIGVGKRAGRPSAKQENVNRLLVEHAQAGARVVRLKSGDSGIFGRLEEEIAALHAAGVAFQVVPGVPTACAAAAAAGIPLTRRLTARRLQFVTGADVTGALPETLNWAAIADPEATTAVFMGKRTFPDMAAGLIAHGLPPDTPALLAENIGKPGQSFHLTTVAGLAEKLSRWRSDLPGLILYGPLALEIARL